MKIRTAHPEDVALIFSFIQKKAEFDRSIGAFLGVLQTSEVKIHKTHFGTVPFSHVLFAESLEREIGFALYQFRYSSFAGQPSIWLDDLYVDDAVRSQGAGTALMHHLAQVAQENNCTHLAWYTDCNDQTKNQGSPQTAPTTVVILRSAIESAAFFTAFSEAGEFSAAAACRAAGGRSVPD